MASAQAALPQNFPAILKDADSQIDTSSTQKVFKQLQSGVFLKQNTQVAKLKQGSDAIDFKLFATALTYNGGVWKRYIDDNQEVVELTSGNGIEVTGDFETCKLSPNETYEVCFLIKMKKRAKGWNNPVTLKFELPNGPTKQTTANLSVKQTDVWIQLTIGDFPTNKGMSGVMKISLSSPDVEEKSGLVIREIDITAK